LKLKYDEPLSNVGFKINLRRYDKEAGTVTAQSSPSAGETPKMFAARVAAGLHGLRSPC
jgi:hypothetical protein